MHLKSFILFTCVLNVAVPANAGNGRFVYREKKDPEICFNPNKQLGNCISVYECDSLRHVLLQKLRSLYSFVRASQCPNGNGTPPFVCCTKDINFRDRFSPRYGDHRIIYPDELDRPKRTDLDGNSQSNETKLVGRTESVDSNEIKNETETNSQIYTTSEKTIPIDLPQNGSLKNEKDLQSSKFPKPPYCGSAIISNRIYGGKDADSGEFSWMVILEYRNLTTGNVVLDCSGSIINKRYILTAAHCVLGEILSVHGRLESVRVGQHNTNTDTDFQRIPIETIIPHKDFNFKSEFRTRNIHDIALLRLSRPIQLTSTLQPVCLPNIETLTELGDDMKFTVAGWGHNGTALRTAVKQKVELPFVKHQVCREKFAKKFDLADEQICAGGRFREDSCGGDSGGPLMRLNTTVNVWILEGIVSFGFGCGLERPGIYTNVRHYLDWIDQHVENDQMS